MNKAQIEERKKRWREENTERVLAQAKASRQRNPEAWKISHKAAKARRRAHKAAAIVEPIRANFKALAIKAFDGKCAYCRIKFSDQVPAEWDHFRPISRGGAHTEYNLVPVCHSCNSVKSNRDPFSFLHNLEIDLKRLPPS